MRLKDIPYLVWYSIMDILADLFRYIESLKNPRTWSFILYAVLFIGAYYKQYTLIKISLPLILLIYIIRQRKEPEFNRKLRERAFLKNDDSKISSYYEEYKNYCFFSRKDALSYEGFKKEEIQKITERKYKE